MSGTRAKHLLNMEAMEACLKKRLFMEKEGE